MNKPAFFRLVICGTLVCTMLTPALARGRKKRTPAPTPHSIVISAISANSITVTDEKMTKTVTVTPFTEITVNGQRASFADLKTGMAVSLGLSSPTQASRITATTQ